VLKSPGDTGLPEPALKREENLAVEEVKSVPVKQRGANGNCKPKEIICSVEVPLPKRPKRGAKDKVAEDRSGNTVKTRRSQRLGMKGKGRSKARKGKEDGGNLIDPELDNDEV
jgi:hypothetical protein